MPTYYVINSFCKVNGAWQNLIGTDIEDVDTNPVTLVEKTITANGTYDPANDNAEGYSLVTANVPNTYAAGDEGKVVSSGALVSQTSATYTANNTYDTTLINSVTVNVSGGGGTGALVEPSYYGLSYGYLNSPSNRAYMAWNGYDAKTNCISIFEVTAQNRLAVFIDSGSHDRYRIGYFAEKTIDDFIDAINNAGSGTIYSNGIYIYDSSTGSSTTQYFFYTPSTDGVIAVMTSASSQLVAAYCVDMDTSSVIVNPATGTYF